MTRVAWPIQTSSRLRRLINHLMRTPLLAITALSLFFSMQSACVSLPELPEEPLLGIDHASLRRRGSEVPPHVPVPIVKVAPRVPPKYLQAGFAVDYDIVFLVGKDGVPKEVTIQNRGRFPDFEKLLLDAFFQWRFRPAVVDGVPTDAVLKMPFTFVGTGNR